MLKMRIKWYNLFVGGPKGAICILSCMFFLTACRGRIFHTSTSDGGDTLMLRYAEYLTMIEYPEYTEVQIRNPWNKGKLLQTIRLKEATRAVFFTAIHSNLVEELGCSDAIVGICETEYIANPRLRHAIAEGRILDTGSAMMPDREGIISLNPDMILLSPYENVATYGNLEILGIPIIQCADYMETSALGRAEWIRFYGRLFGKGHEADSLFAVIEAEYGILKTLTDSIAESNRPTVLFDTRNGSAWYVPGGRSTMAQLVEDAGGRYVFDDNAKSGSVPLSFESVFNRGKDADIWLIRYNNGSSRIRLADFGKVYQPYTLFRAYEAGKVYGCNSAELIFYEETPFHPERILRDYICILHPELLPNDTLRYFHKL